MVGNHLEELEVDHVEARSVILRDLHLLEKRLAQYGNWDVLQPLEEVDKVLQHHVPDFDLPVELN